MKINFDNVPDPGDRYEIGDVLGFGVYGRVYSAADGQASKRNVAIKIQKYDNGTKEYVEEEYKILRDLSNHANLVDFYGIYKKNGEIWFVLELCAGGPVIDLVHDLLAKNRRMAEEHIAYVLKETVKALIYLHENNVIHRDVKCSNILLTRDGEVKLCDFGLAQRTTDKDEKLFARLGSPCWMAPELASVNSNEKEGGYDNRVDVWAIGITAIELGEGRAPFQDMHPTRILFQIVTNTPPALQKISYWSENYHDFISECLVKYFDYRPYIMEIINHPFLQQIPENNYHLTLEIKSLLSDLEKLDPLSRCVEVNINGKFLKKSVDGDMEPMYEEDLAALDSITENNILTLLEKRVNVGEPYCFIGDILLYLNPNEKKNIFGDAFQRKYYFKSRSENAPHIYSTADTAYQNVLHHVVPQQIVLSGESGSGKTTNYLHLLDHLFYLGENPSINSVRIKNAVKLIHSLIHASTPINDYSTRAILKTNVSYGGTGKLSGASFRVHCLEKWRVSSTDMTQSNFHILYYIYNGLVATDCAEKYKLNSNREYRYLRTGKESKTNQPKNDTTKSVIKYEKIRNYLDELEFSEEERRTILSVVAAILNLGEAQFEEDDDGLAAVVNKEAAECFSELLEVDNEKILRALTNYDLVHKGQTIHRKNTCEEARDARDVLANNIYARLVDYIVSFINNKLSFGKAIFGEKYTIKILDYFGFECFEQNNFPQFLVNCLNEQLHYHFLQRVFSWETMDLQNEEVNYIPINYYNNKDTLNDLLGIPEGVLSIIDDASKKGHGGRYVIDNIRNQEKAKVIVSDALEFSVSHYTGKVSYSAREMPEKNRDFLSPEIVETMRSSQNAIISMFFTNKLDRNGNLLIPSEEVKKNKYSFASKMSSVKQFSQIRKMRTQASIFRACCLDLLKELSVGSGSGGTHFVRCVRTDLKRRPQHFEKELVRQQIRALAIVETARARQQGYPHRVSFPEFLRRYKFLAFDFEENVELTKENCRLLMVRLKMEGWAIGKTKVFLKYYNEEYLSRLYETQVKKIVKIQSILRGFIAKCRVAKKVKDQEKDCITEIKKWRRSSVLTEEEAAEIIQKAYRKSTKRKELSDMYTPLEEEDYNFIKPFAAKWRNKSMFYVLMRYRAVKLQDFFNFSQQVHFYNSNAFHNVQEIADIVDLKSIDSKATISTWIGDHIVPVSKLNFRLDEIPFYDTASMYNLLTNLGNYEKEDPWDTPYLWRESQFKETTAEALENIEDARNMFSIQYIRDPDGPIISLPSPPEVAEEDAKDAATIENVTPSLNEDDEKRQSPKLESVKDDIETIDNVITSLNEDAEKIQSPKIDTDEENIEKSDKKDREASDNECVEEREIPNVQEIKSDADSNAENIDLKNGTGAASLELETDSNDSRKLEDSSDEAENLLKENEDMKENEPPTDPTGSKKGDKNISEQESYNINTKLANKDFDYIKSSPVSLKPKTCIDPIAELRNISRKNSNASDDDPPFNFQGMLRKTNFRRDSMKKEVVRKESLKNGAKVVRKDSLKNVTEVVKKDEDVRRESLKDVVEIIRKDSLKKLTEVVRKDSLKNEAKVERKDSLKKSEEILRNKATEARRESLKNALEIVRRFSLTKDQEKNDKVMVNGNVEEKPVLSKPVTLEILPGLFIDGLEIEL